MDRVTISRGYDNDTESYPSYYAKLNKISVESCEDGYLYYSTICKASYQFELRTMDYKILTKDSVVLFCRDSGEIIHFIK